MNVLTAPSQLCPGIRIHAIDMVQPRAWACRRTCLCTNRCCRAGNKQERAGRENIRSCASAMRPGYGGFSQDHEPFCRWRQIRTVFIVTPHPELLSVALIAPLGVGLDS
jgi:hypothetical protein